jgi:hypothetical protein
VAILPIDIQALLVRMDTVSKSQQAQRPEGIALFQSLKGNELEEQARIESSRVNDVQNQPDGSNKIEDEQKKERRSQVQHRSGKKGGRGKGGRNRFEDPEKGKIIDVTR